MMKNIMRKSKRMRSKYLVIAGAILAVGTAAAFGATAWRTHTASRQGERNPASA